MAENTTVQAILEKAASSLEKVAEERDFYKTEYQKLANEVDVRDVMDLMSERGLMTDVTKDDLKADLLKKAELNKLASTKEAVLMSRDGIVSLGGADDQSGMAMASDRSKAALEAYLASGELD
jgi:hypothetical protein